jgi:hypothetical protein
MKLNNRDLHTHIKDNPDTWKAEFEGVDTLVDEIIKSPNCGICLQKMIKEIITQDYGTIIKKIYNDETVTGMIVTQQVERKKEVKEFTTEEWEKFYTNTQVQYQNSMLYYNSDTKKVVLSYTGNENSPTKHAF